MHPEMSDNALAEHCGVSHTFVGKVRLETVASGATRTGKDGRTIDTSNIGRRPRIPMPALEPGKCYRWRADDPGSLTAPAIVAIEIIPHPQPGYWQMLCLHDSPQDGPSWMTFFKCGGMKIDNRTLWECMVRDAMPAGQWLDVPAEELLLAPFLEAA